MERIERPARWPAWALPGLAISWLGCFGYLGLASRLPSIPGLVGDEKVAAFGHLTATLILAVLLHALIRTRNLEYPATRVALEAAAIATVAGGAIEIMQSLSTVRSPQLADWGFDGLGAAVGAALMFSIDRKPALRPGLVTGAHMFGAAATMAAISAILLLSPVSADEEPETSAYCPPTVERRRTPVEDPEAGLGTRVTQGLVALYDFWDSARDGSGVSPPIDLQLQGGAAIRDGRLRMRGSESLARARGPAVKIHRAFTATDAFTIEAWVRPDDLLQFGPARIVSSSIGTTLDEVNFHLAQESTCLSFRVATGDGEAAWLLTSGVFTRPQAAWHLAVTYDSGSTAVFVDGVIVEQDLIEPGPLNDWELDWPLLVGNEATLDRPFEGDVFMVALYDRALAPAEIERNFVAGALPGE